MRTLSLLGALCFTFSIALQAQQIELNPERFQFEPNLSFDKNIQTPADFLGYELGERFTIYEKSVQYFYQLAAQSDRVDIHQYGETYEGRPLLNLVISTPENLQNIDGIKQSHLELLDAHQLSAKDLDDRLENEPVFTSISYNIHGNEASSTEAAMQVAYRIAAAQDAATEQMLEESILIFYVCINPDGRDRYVYWANSVESKMIGVAPEDLEHYAPWPNGRTNHYWFDLNRDWLWGVHPESRGHTGEYQKWMPQVHVDYHEQGYNANYFTAPGTTPRNMLLPNRYEAWSDTFGRANVEFFDKEGLMYFTRDRFDFFYPGYGSSYPTVMGAIGMLTEQGGIGAGRAVETEDGYNLLFRQRIYDQYHTALATVFKSAERRVELLKYSIDAWNPANSKESTKTYIIRQEEGGYLTDFLNVFARNKIEVHKATADFTANNVLDYRTGERGTQSFKAGDLLVSTDQSRHLFIHSMLTRQMGIEDSVMYDMATWSAPLAYNLEAYASEGEVKVAQELVTAADAMPASGLFSLAKNNADLYAYVIDWTQRWAPRALSTLWEKGYRVRSALEPFSFNGTTFSGGSLIVLRGRNETPVDEMRTAMVDIAKEAAVKIYAMPTGRMDTGYDLASSRNRPVEQPRVAMLVEPPFNTYTCGQVYFLFDQETELPIDRIRTSAFNQTSLPKFGQRYGYAELNDYDVLILTGGRSLGQLFSGQAWDEIINWVQDGGTLVTMERAAQFFTGSNKLSVVRLHQIGRDTNEAVRTLAYADRESYSGKRRIPGSALLAHIDTSHPMAFGVKPQLYDLKFGNTALLPDASFQSVGLYHKDPNQLFVSGYASQENLDHLAGNAFAGVQDLGAGKIVYLLDNQHYRMFWRGGSRMLQNAVMLLGNF